MFLPSEGTPALRQSLLAKPSVTPAPADGDKLHLLSAVATLCNSVMGVGVLALPRAVANVGLLPGVAMIIAIASLSLLTLGLLAESIREWKATTYAQLVHRAIGPAASKVCAVAVMINLFGACVGANVAMAATFDDLLNRANLTAVDARTGQVESLLAHNALHLPPLSNRQLGTVVLGTGLVLPLSLRGSYRALVPASLLSTVSVSVLAAVASGFAVAAALPGGDGIPCQRCPKLEMWRFDDELLDSVSVFMFAFVTHSILPQVLAELDNPTEKRVRQTLCLVVVSTFVFFAWRLAPGLRLGVMFYVFCSAPLFASRNLQSLRNYVVVRGVRCVQGFVGVVYLAVAVSGYLQFSANVCGTITESFETLAQSASEGGGGDFLNTTSAGGGVQQSGAATWVTVSQLLVVLSLGAGFPTTLWPCRDAICFLLFGGAPSPQQGGAATRACICVMVWASSCAVAMFVSGLDEVLEVVGATVSCIVAFVLPFMCFTQLRNGNLVLWRRVLLTPSGLSSLLGIALTLCSTYMVAKNLLANSSEATAREEICERTSAGFGNSSADT